MIEGIRRRWRAYQQPITGDGGEWPSTSAYRQACKNSRLEKLTGGSQRSGITLLSVVRNEADILPAFLEHYRALGVQSFIIIDNHSTDGTTSLLSAEPDVNLYSTGDGFATALAGRMWIDHLAHRFCKNRWVLHVDADEFLVYQDWQKRPLEDLIRVMRRLGLKRLSAPMVDLYNLEDGSYFDARPEQLVHDHIGVHLEGGPRQRMALRYDSSPPWLSKYPLTFYDRRTSYATVHHPYPRQRNDQSCFARLLHTKISDRFVEKIATALDEKQHAGASKEYRVYEKWAGSDLRETYSRRYERPEDLIDAGLMSPVPWDK